MTTRTALPELLVAYSLALSVVSFLSIEGASGRLLTVCVPFTDHDGLLKSHPNTSLESYLPVSFQQVPMEQSKWAVRRNLNLSNALIISFLYFLGLASAVSILSFLWGCYSVEEIRRKVRHA